MRATWSILSDLKEKLTDWFQLLAPIMVWIIIGKRRNYKLLAVLLLIRDITSQCYPLSRRERVILIQYLPPEIYQNEKNYFYPRKPYFLTQNYVPHYAFPCFLAWGGGGGGRHVWLQMWSDRKVIPKKTQTGPLIMCCTRVVNSVNDYCK